MSIQKEYVVRVNVESADDIDEMEEQFETSLMQLYDAGGVEAVHVIDKGSVDNDEDMQELIDILDRLESKELMRSIDFALEMEDYDDE